MQKYLIKSFKGLDIFGSDVSLNYKNDAIYRTAFGGMITIIFACFMVVFFFNNNNLSAYKQNVQIKQQVKTLVSKSNHKILFLTQSSFSFLKIFKAQITFVESVEYNTDPDILEVGSNNFMIAVKNDQQNFISKPQYNITFEWRHYKRFQNGTYIQSKNPMQLEPCTIDHFANIPSKQINWSQAFVEQNLADFLCLKKGEVYKIGGAFSSNDFYHIKFSVVNCVNQTQWPDNFAWQPVCDTPQNIKASQSKSTRVNFLLTNMQVNPEKTTDPAQSFINSLIFSFQPSKMYTTANLNLNQQTINTDESLVPLTDISSESFTVHKNNDYTQSFSVGDFSTFCDIYFIRSFFTTTYDRQYLKINEVISYIGGFCQVFLLISAIIVDYYNHYVYTFELANRLYDFDIKRKKKNSKKQNEQNQMDKYTINITEADQNQQMTTMADEQNKINKNHLKPKIKDFLRIKSLNQDGRILTREDAGLIPLDQIQRMLEKQDNAININLNIKDQELKNKANDLKQQNNIFNSTNPSNTLGLYNLNKKDYLIADKENLNQKQEQNKQFNQLGNSFILDNHQGVKNDGEFKQGKINENDNNSNQKCKETNIDQLITSPQFHNQLLSSDRNQLLQNNQNFDLEKSDLQIIQNLKTKRSTSSNINYLHNDPSTNQKILINENLTNNMFQRNKQTSVVTPKSSVQKPIFGELEKKEFLDRELKFLLLRERSLHFNLKFFFNKITCGKFFNSDEIKLLQKADDHIREDLDIFNILDRLKEIEKLKKLFLSHEQQTLFNFFPKPIVSIDQQNNIIDRKTLLTEIEQKQDERPRKDSNKLQISLKNIGIVSKAISKFKNSSKKSQLSHYQKLYSCYEKLIEDDKNEMKKKSKENINQSIGSSLFFQNKQPQNNNHEVSKFMQEKDHLSLFAYNIQINNDQKSTQKNESNKNSNLTLSDQQIQPQQNPSKEQITENDQNKMAGSQIQEDIIIFDQNEEDLSSIKEN